MYESATAFHVNKLLDVLAVNFYRAFRGYFGCPPGKARKQGSNQIPA